MAGEFKIGSGGSGSNCGDVVTRGQKSVRYDYIFKGQTDRETYPDDACEPWYHGNAQIDNLIVHGEVEANTVSAVYKSFNISHPIKENKRLVHGCLEGPEYGVYIRGRLTDNNVIELPDYWNGLVDPETISVHLTQIGSSQYLIVDKILWGSAIHIKSGTASMIDCYYTVNAMRIDIPALEIEQDA